MIWAKLLQPCFNFLAIFFFIDIIYFQSLIITPEEQIKCRHGSAVTQLSLGLCHAETILSSLASFGTRDHTDGLNICNFH